MNETALLQEILRTVEFGTAEWDANSTENIKRRNAWLTKHFPAYL